ncbi:QueT transporter family protein [Sporolactobacillus terrae]|uniref:Membrane protein n=1 Tax=Sporolactobacillus terrae TaxID=269673 RepID=A0A410D911_9BACL|nr:QueT transporter family protein [Sporolactobacillus terrae]QAA22603.1 QueT transporter family protein [Sporolactobacillus terrae]QAA25577.1 QueT transporter family protein [Sporolactobacillus terrae]UAK17385.1 QueT transporter family protein [Sporolactobacillus terrae]BBN98926.1 membrane protein [Sporolactobacillus terrae]
MKTVKMLAVNALLAAIYIVLTFFLQPISFSAVQFRISEMLNHMIVFNKKYFWGIICGVFLGNLFFSPMLPYDLIFGTGQSVLALLTTMIVSKFITNIWARMLVNTGVFTLTMCFIAWELAIVLKLPFLWTWLTVAIGECVVMLIGMPIMYAINRRAKLDKLI